MNKVPNVIVVSSVIGFVSTLAALTFLSAAEKDATQLVYFVGVVIGAAVPGALNSAKVSQVRDIAARTELNTNGRMSHLVSIIEATGATLPDEYADVPRIPIMAQTATQQRGDIVDADGRREQPTQQPGDIVDADGPVGREQP